MRGGSPTAATYTAFSKRNGFWMFRERPNERLKRKRAHIHQGLGHSLAPIHRRRPIRIATYHVTTLKISLLKDLDTYIKVRT